MKFEIDARSGKARRGALTTAHGVIRTPAFMPVGTLGAVKGIPPDQLESVGASVMLANLYHLTLRPGIDLLEAAGGLHRFCGWQRPILTDSGGYQVFSLARLRKLDPGGVSFRNHIDGSLLRLTPEDVVDSQRRMGVDLAMVLDECPPWPISEKEAAASLELTMAWSRRSRERWARETSGNDTAGRGLFGIVQGSVYRDLRLRAVEELTELDFDGYAIGGVSVGEAREHCRSVVEWSAPALPADKPRYLMGVGTPADIFHAVSNGVDLFDCVLPSRNARHGTLFSKDGILRIKNARYKSDSRPVDENCPCPLCRRTSRAFLHHLFRTRELTGPVLATLHNLRFYLDFMADLRERIALGSLADLSVPATHSTAETC